MSQQPKLIVNKRTGTGRSAAKKLRRDGQIPVVMYGSHSTTAENFEVAYKDIDRILNHSVSESVLVDVEISGDSKKKNRSALIQAVQHHPVTRLILHVDLREVSMDEVITTSIPVEAVGEAIGVKNNGGLLEQLVYEIEIECLPKDLPEAIRVDVSGLEIGGAIHIANLQLPNGVKVLADKEIAVFNVAAPRIEEATTDTAAPTAPEVIGEKKAEKDESAKQ